MGFPYEPSNYERAALTFPRAHSITQAVGDSAAIVSRDQESELMSSLNCTQAFVLGCLESECSTVI